jgi:hypothetical protein
MSGEELRFGSSESGGRSIGSLFLLGGFALALSLLGPAAGAAPPESSGVAVEYVPPTLTLRVTQSIELRTVLQTLCYYTEAECMITYASQIMVAPTTLTGTWNEVAAKLARSFNLNYAAVAPTAGRPGMLAVLGSAGTSGENVMVKGNRNTFESVPDAPSSPVDLTPASPDLTGQKSPQRSDRDPSKGSDSSASLPKAFGGPVDVNQTSELSRGEEATPHPGLLQVSERSFRTMYGGGLLTNQSLGSPPRTVVLPYSDANGNPITVSVINEPVTVLPWPGPDGFPSIVPPGTPGLKLAPPFPPSTPAL